MKTRLLSWLVCTLISVMALAQSDVTKFLGIPVDGSVDAMARKLEAKGFKIVLRESECVTMEGVFNGAKSNIFVFGNGHKVGKIGVAEDLTIESRTNAKNRYNRIVKQFMNKSGYTYLDVNLIPDDEDIEYEMLVKDKQYRTTFYQMPEWPNAKNLSKEELENSDCIVAKFYRLLRRRGVDAKDGDISNDKLKEATYSIMHGMLTGEMSEEDKAVMMELMDELSQKPVMVSLNRLGYHGYYISYTYYNPQNEYSDEDL